MKILLSDSSLAQTTDDTVVLFGFEDRNVSSLYSDILSESMRKLVKTAESTDFKGKENSVIPLYNVSGTPKKLLLVGLGKSSKFTLASIRDGIGTAVNAAINLGSKEISVPIMPFDSIPSQDIVIGVTESAVLANHKFKLYGEPHINLASVIIALKRITPELAKALNRGKITGTAQNAARDLCNYPGSIATPKYIAEYAKKLCKGKVKCTVYDKKGISKLKMNGVLAVASGSVHEPRFLVIEYNNNTSQKPIVIVGKGITFDSGGLSLKFPAVYMETMKHDNSGAAITLFTILAAANLNIKANLVGLIPLAENMPGNNAYKPGDIIKTMSGKTVEILNTDAEGRIILCDALFYAHRYKPKYIVDIATLTGSCWLTFGTDIAGIMGNDEKLTTLLRTSGDFTKELLWPLPMNDFYGTGLKSNFADLKNVVANTMDSGGTISAAKFLENFVGNYKWAHIDIGGTGWVDKHKDYRQPGATAFGLRLLVDFLVRNS